MFWILDGMLFSAGFAASVYVWPWLRTQIQGAQTEILALEARTAALKVSLGISPVAPNPVGTRVPPVATTVLPRVLPVSPPSSGA